MRKRSWSEQQLRDATSQCRSIRQILQKLRLKDAGGNYYQIRKYLHFYKINISKLKGKGWSKGDKLPFKPKIPLAEILVEDSSFQSYKLKARLFKVGMKNQKCEICGWSKKSADGRIPLELDHINGNHRDNRLENLRVLCPNCHSLQPTHRGLRIKNGPVVERYTRGT